MCCGLRCVEFYAIFIDGFKIRVELSLPTELIILPLTDIVSFIMESRGGRSSGFRFYPL